MRQRLHHMAEASVAEEGIDCSVLRDNCQVASPAREGARRRGVNDKYHSPGSSVPSGSGCTSPANHQQNADNAVDTRPIASLFTMFDVDDCGALSAPHGASAVSAASLSSHPSSIAYDMGSQRNGYASSVSYSCLPRRNCTDASQTREGSITGDLNRPWQHKNQRPPQLSQTHLSYPAPYRTLGFNPFSVYGMMSSPDMATKSLAAVSTKPQHEPYGYSSNMISPISAGNPLRTPRDGTSPSHMSAVAMQTTTEEDDNVTVTIRPKMRRASGSAGTGLVFGSPHFPHQSHTRCTPGVTSLCCTSLSETQTRINTSVLSIEATPMKDDPPQPDFVTQAPTFTEQDGRRVCSDEKCSIGDVELPQAVLSSSAKPKTVTNGENSHKNDKEDEFREKSNSKQQQVSLNDEHLRVVVVKGKYQCKRFVTDLDSVAIGTLVIVEGDRGEDIGTVESIEDYVSAVAAHAAEKATTPVEDGDECAKDATEEGHHLKGAVTGAGSNHSSRSSSGHSDKNAGASKSFPCVLRVATDEDRTKLAALRAEDASVLPEARRIVTSFTNSTPSSAGVTTEDVEYQFDRQKITIYVRRPTETAFVNFRRIQRRLYRLLKCRIWLAYMDEVESGEGFDVQKQKRKAKKNEKHDDVKDILE
ncbi:hypothetical protein DQ04_03221050 [Trypanosoma grayi]|uniref:hypothetical protein n=1 Tax=Trypanosoma grayi TaxID=71804 RepID=UPI0004F4072A|nr:hypothetical protein DQ04_03221050 [Trypanosoma grayi]KEG10855.1 hypothetical protein DQ04_03221050 [Trypanosoma grayi]